MKEVLRQAVHLAFGLGIAVFIAAVNREISVPVLMLALFGGFILSDAIVRGYYIPLISPIIEGLDRRDAIPGKGALFFALGALFCLVFFPSRFVFIALVVLSLLDSVTTLVGVRFGRTRIYNHKSVEGTLAGIAAAAAVLLLLIHPLPALAVAVASGLAEFLAPVDDNLVVPVVACVVLAVLL